jgi:prepilin-type N-terminal cleavage/methylation domain-containing protein/prepilin-type processing-associated H-X9-DG protein
MRTLNRGFSLVELLVVIAIIGVLAAMLAPALASGQQRAQSMACMNQMKQIALATRQYAHDNNSRLPRSSHSALSVRAKPWGYALMPYLGAEKYTGPGPAWDAVFNGVYRCPQDSRRKEWSYGKNVWFELASGETGELMGAAGGPTYEYIENVRRPSATILYGELGSGSMGDHIMAHYWYQGGTPEVDATRHGTTSNYAFVDGHVETLEFNATFDLDAKVDLWDPGKAGR